MKQSTWIENAEVKKKERAKSLKSLRKGFERIIFFLCESGIFDLLQVKGGDTGRDNRATEEVRKKERGRWSLQKFPEAAPLIYRCFLGLIVDTVVP
jgi:hypothetical protein